MMTHNSAGKLEAIYQKRAEIVQARQETTFYEVDIPVKIPQKTARNFNTKIFPIIQYLKIELEKKERTATIEKCPSFISLRVYFGGNVEIIYTLELIDSFVFSFVESLEHAPETGNIGNLIKPCPLTELNEIMVLDDFLDNYERKLCRSIS
jgi:hypothetical protein